MKALTFIFLLFLWVPLARGSKVEFRADYYSRDLGRNVTIGKGNAWIKSGGREVWANEIELDSVKKLATATGDVRIQDGEHRISAAHGVIYLDSDHAILDQAVISSDQMILQGNTVEKVGKDQYRVLEGSYTNCNLSKVNAEDFSNCRPDWRLYGKRIEVTLGGYAHIYDAIVYAKQLPIMYSPYLVVPAKTSRETGILTPGIFSLSGLGTGVTVPFFWAIDSWHDLTITPTNYDKVGYHVGLDYRYIYSPGKRGQAKFFFTQRRFSSDPNDKAPDDTTRGRALGFIGEAALNLHNVYDLGGRTHTRQVVKLVSDPYYARDYFDDLDGEASFSYLRSFLSITAPSDGALFTGQVRHFQSLTISQDTGVDRGAAIELPNLTYSRSTRPLISKYLSFELDSSFANYYRPQPFDQVPSTPNPTGINADVDPSFDGNDYLRTGQRILVTPSLIANIPLGSSLQLQPSVTLGGVLYHFNHPSSTVIHREFLDVELPFSVYLSRKFDIGLSDFQKIKHVFQPRVVYASRPFDSGSLNHPFFFQNTTTNLSNPRFDLQDRFSKFEYLRFELLNRFYRQGDDGIHRFFRVQLSQNYNLRTFATDPRFSRRLGPIEVISDFTYWKLAMQFQGSYELETVKDESNQDIHEHSWSAALNYSPSGRDSFVLNVLSRTRSKRVDTEQAASLGFYKELPFLFDITGNIDYSIKEGRVVSYSTGFVFRGRPRSCWELILRTGQDSARRTFVGFNFQLFFGSLGGSPIKLTFQ